MDKLSNICYKIGYIQGKLFTIENKENTYIIQELISRLDNLKDYIVNNIDEKEIKNKDELNRIINQIIGEEGENGNIQKCTYIILGRHKGPRNNDA